MGNMQIKDVGDILTYEVSPFGYRMPLILAGGILVSGIAFLSMIYIANELQK